jgi:hypothetical protein
LETSSHNPHIGGGRHIGSFLKNTNGKGKFSFLVYYTQIKKYINQMPSGKQLLIFSWFLYLNNQTRADPPEIPGLRAHGYAKLYQRPGRVSGAGSRY